MAVYQETQNIQNITSYQDELMSIMKEEVIRVKEKKLPIIRAFEQVAKKTGLKANTIRNYYYKYIHTHIQQSTNSDTEGPEAVIGQPFSKDETRKLIFEMLKAQAKGESVRGCANRLSNGNKKLLVRYQNKYRSIIARNPEFVKEIIDDMIRDNIEYYNPYEDGIRGFKGSAYKKGNITNKKIIKEEGYNDTYSDDKLINILGQLVNNMRKVDDISIQYFFKGLMGLSEIAAKEKNSKIYGKKEDGSTFKVFQEIMDINRRFIDLPEIDKIIGLKTYITQLKNCFDHMRETNV